jgi:hypothetical protein
MLRAAATPILVLVFFLSAAHAQPASPIDLTRVGPQVGERVPDFEGTDQGGRQRNLTSVLGPKGAMIVIFRSADW